MNFPAYELLFNGEVAGKTATPVRVRVSLRRPDRSLLPPSPEGDAGPGAELLRGDGLSNPAWRKPLPWGRMCLRPGFIDISSVMREWKRLSRPGGSRPHLCMRVPLSALGRHPCFSAPGPLRTRMAPRDGRAPIVQPVFSSLLISICSFWPSSLSREEVCFKFCPLIYFHHFLLKKQKHNQQSPHRTVGAKPGGEG